ncbi:MAG TPA: hypothetical protein VMZ71_06380 [Gemmataceae bacterium]|nr:hypothetical protein [Gemmataceae bacterium]
MVRWTLGLVAAAVLSAPAVAQDNSKAIIEKAIKESGGEAKLRMFPAGSSQMKGKMIISGMDLPFTGSMTFASPDKIRMDLAVDIGGKQVKLVQVVNGTAVKQTEDGKQVENITEAAKTELLQGARLQEIALLYPLLDATKYTLKEGKGTIDTAEVVVEGKGLKPVTLYFDKKTGLLSKMTREGLSPAGVKVAEETTYTDYKDVSGIMVPMKSQVTHEGKLFLDITVTEYKPLDKTEEKFDTGS